MAKRWGLVGALAGLALLMVGGAIFFRPVELSVPVCGIQVQCIRVAAPSSSKLQALVDEPEQAVWYGRYILDHAGQEFYGLWNMAVGDAMRLGKREYRCRFVTTGWSNCGIRAAKGRLPRADLYLCTCVPDGAEYEIYIVGMERVPS